MSPAAIIALIQALLPILAQLEPAVVAAIEAALGINQAPAGASPAAPIHPVIAAALVKALAPHVASVSAK